MPKKIKRKASGKYLLSVSVGYNSNGKQVVRTKMVDANSDLEARRCYAKFETEVLGGHKVQTRKSLRLSEFADIWLRDYCNKNLSPSTVVGYRNQLRLRIIPELGYKKIDKIMPMDIIRFINIMQEKRNRFDHREKSLSDEVISYAFHVLASMLHDAVEWQLIDSNPCDTVPRPKVHHRKIVLPPEKDITAIIRELGEAPLKYRTLAFLAIATGMRRGEILGLKWTDIDFDKGLLHVERTVQVIERQLVLKEPKTVSSQRTIALPAFLIDLLNEYKAEQDKLKELLLNRWLNQDWIFTTWNGRYMNPSTPSQWLHDFLLEKGLAMISFHALRHLSATILISEGIPLKNVSSRLGHSDIRTTANIYSDALQSVDKDASIKMNQYLQQQKNDAQNKQ